MKTLNLYLDMEFTSLSPDAQIISVGIVSDDTDTFSKRIGKSDSTIPGESFYVEFTDFDIHRCDDWVKENVVGKLRFPKEMWNNVYEEPDLNTGSIIGAGCTASIKMMLSKWLSKFSDYQIQIVVDCGTWDWYHFLQLVGEWDSNSNPIGEIIWHKTDTKDYFNGVDEAGRLFEKINNKINILDDVVKSGLPKLPSNISPVPLDLNDLILHKYLNRVSSLFTAKDAFNVNRETLMYLLDGNKQENELYEVVDNTYTLKENSKHNSLFDAKIIKSIYQKLMM